MPEIEEAVKSGFIKIPVHLGLVETKDPAVLEDGELSKADDSYYKPNDGRVWKVPGRSPFNSIAEEAGISGAVNARFDGVILDRFIALVGTSLRIGPAGLSGSFEDLATGLSTPDEGPSNLAGIHFRNQWFLFNGVDRGRWLKSTDSNGNTVNPPGATSLFLHGMLANTDPPTLNATGGVGTGFTLASGAKITYWIEERVKHGSAIVKRNATAFDVVDDTGNAVILTGDGTTTFKPLLTHTTVNSDTTHIALFATATDGQFPQGAEIQEVVVGVTTTSVEDDRTTNDPEFPSGSTYELLTASLFGAVVAVARNGPPPTAIVGALFNNSLVLNDLDNPSFIRYSWANEPHQFPDTNFIQFPTGENDKVVVILKMGSVCMIGLRDGLWRVNMLPRPEDASFDTIRVKDEVEGAFGVVGPKAATTFSFGEGNRMAYVSTAGLMVATETDWDIMSDDIDFDAAVEPSKLEDSVLINSPQTFELIFYYTPKGGTHNTRAYRFNYHPSHLKRTERGIRLKATGPINVEAKTAMRALIDGQRRIFTSSIGKLFLEAGSDADQSEAGGIKMDVRTREVFPYDVGRESKLETLWAHHIASSNQEATLTSFGRNEGEDDDEQTGVIKLDRREQTQADIQGQAESYIFGFANSDGLGPVALDFFYALVGSEGFSEQG